MANSRLCPKFFLDLRRLVGCPHAFSLVEALLVVAMLSLLSALLIPMLAKAVDTSRQVSCSDNLQKLYGIIGAYAIDYNGIQPPIVGWIVPGYKPYWTETLMNTGYVPHKWYVPDPGYRELFCCPAMPAKPSSYVYYDDYGQNTYLNPTTGVGLRPARIKKTSSLLMIADTRAPDATTGWNPEYIGFFRFHPQSICTANYGYPDNRHMGNVVTIWVDGHASTYYCPDNVYTSVPFGPGNRNYFQY